MKADVVALKQRMEESTPQAFAKISGTTCGVFQEFVDFISQGSVVDLAIGIILGSAFTDIVNSLVKDIISPVMALFGDGGNMEEKFIILRYSDSSNLTSFATIEQAAKAGAVTLNWGRFFSSIINFVLVGIILFILVKIAMTCAKCARGDNYVSDEFQCPKCCEPVKQGAERCPHCTSELGERTKED